MSDLIYLALVLAFFALAAAFVRGCERIIGPDEPSTNRTTEPSEVTA